PSPCGQYLVSQGTCQWAIRGRCEIICNSFDSCPDLAARGLEAVPKPLPRPLPEAGRGEKLIFLPSPLRGGAGGGGFKWPLMRPPTMRIKRTPAASARATPSAGRAIQRIRFTSRDLEELASTSKESRRPSAVRLV